MKKRFLPISLLLTIIILAQTSFVVNANGDSGKYNPRSSSQATAQSFFKSIRANQETGLIDPAWLIQERDMSKTSVSSEDWTSLGPDNYGSLTRGIVYDKKDATGSTIYIGTMGGGVFKTVNAGITWQSVSNNMMVSTMAQAEDGTIYIGTGDGRSAHNYNGLSQLNYEQSFAGDGIYVSTQGNEFVVLPNTTSWAFINEITIYGDNIYVATNEGLKHSTNKGESWSTLLEGEAFSVKVGEDGTVLSVVDNSIYMSTENGFVNITNDELLPSSDNHKIIAMSQSDANYMYVAYLTATYGTGNIYVTSDHGATWVVAHMATPIYNIFETRGNIDNAMTVYPNDPRKVLIGGADLWVLRDNYGDGVYRLERISSGASVQYSGVYNYSYIHYGIQNIVFNPFDEGKFLVGSEGGITKGWHSSSSSNGYLFEGANRYFIEEDYHTSTTRMFSVGFGGLEDMVIGGSLDHGTIKVLGISDLNNTSTGNAIFPNDNAATDAFATYGVFSYSMAAGPCAVSTICPDIMFVTTTGSYTGGVGAPIFRTQTSGVDYDKDNFSYSVTESSPYIENEDVFRTPIALFENFNDTKAVETVKFYARARAYAAGEVVTFRSNNGEYPIEYTLTADLAQGDSLEIIDNISSTLLVATADNGLLMTRDALQFDELTEWWTIGDVDGTPNALTISADGNVALVGTIESKLYKATGLSDAVTTEAFEGDSIVPSVVTFEELDATAFNGQAITSISIDPRNSNNIIVTLGNYGNNDYVFYSTDGGASFNSVQANLPKMPVYSSVIEKASGKVLVGTEKGVYVSENLNSWDGFAEGVQSNIPVMDLKQQLHESRPSRYVYVIGEQQDTTDVIEYPGVFNEGMIYAATYGKGLIRYDEYHVNGNEISVDEIISAKELEMSIFPNPVVSQANISFNLEESANVSYQIYDLSGRLVRNAVLGNYGQGSHQVTFNVDGFTAGAYIVKVQAGATSKTAKILVY